MVLDPTSLSRRQLLAGLAGGTGIVGGGTLTIGATRPTALPNRLTDWATNYYPTPPAASSLWQPTVTGAHARNAVALLDETDHAARERWEEIDRDERRLRGSGGWLESAEESLKDGDYNDALFQATYGMQFASEDLGKARAELGEANLDDLADRSVDLFDRIDAVVDELESYPVADPERDLAWYVHIEIELQQGRHLADWRGLEDVREDDAGENDPDLSEYEPREIGEITSGLLQAEIAVENAERYRDRLWTDVEGADEYDAHLRGVLADLEDELESIPTRREVKSTYIDDDVDTYGPYEFAHSRLAQWCFPASISPPWEQAVGDDFLVLRVLGASRGLVDWRAHDDAVGELEVTADDETFDSGHVLSEKRRARSTHRTVVGSDPTPFLTVLAEQAIGNIRTADVDRDSWDSSWEPWNERVQAYLHALIGRARLKEYPDVYDLIVGEN